jgi:hypothetical protein
MRGSERPCAIAMGARARGNHPGARRPAVTQDVNRTDRRLSEISLSFVIKREPSWLTERKLAIPASPSPSGWPRSISLSVADICNRHRG